MATARILAISPVPLAALIGAGLALGGCATFSQDGGFDPVAQQTRARLNQEVRWARTDEEAAKSDVQVAALLDHELSADDAVQIALLSNRMLQASFEQLGISEADLVQSGRPPNPVFTLRHTAAPPNTTSRRPSPSVFWRCSPLLLPMISKSGASPKRRPAWSSPW